MERNNVLLKITDLRQYFPVGKKKGLYVKANDGISLNIYEGETVGLVGESGCGKSTFGRTLLQLYRQTDGKTMYYGASRDELAPEYIEKTIRHLPHGLHELAALEKKRDEMQKVYDAADEQKRLHMHNDLTAAKKAANDAYLNIVNVIGGFITAKDLGPVMKIFSERHDRCCDLHKAIEKRAPVKLNYDEEAFKLSKLNAGERGYDSRKGKLDKLAEKVAEHDKLVEAARAEIAKVDARIDAMRAKYAADPEFQKHEALLDNGIDLARLTYPEVRTLRCQMQYIFQDPYSSLDPRKTASYSIEEAMKVHHIGDTARERRQKALESLQEVGLDIQHMERYPHEFSGGQRQRVNIARALSMEPKIIVCDEPVSALDVSIQAQVVNMFEDLQQEMGLTYLFIAHDLSVVKHISNRIGVMYLGKLVELADSFELIAHSIHPYTRSLISAIPVADPITARQSKRIVLQGDVPSPLNPPSGCRFRTRCPYADERCAAEVPEFKEVTSGHWAACHHLDKVK